MKGMTVSDAYGRAFESLKNNWAMLTALLAIYVGVSMVSGIAEMFVSGIALVGFKFLSLIVNCIFYLLVVKFVLKVAEANGEPVQLFSEMELEGDEVLRFLLTYLLILVIVFSAMLICFLPVVILALLTIGAAVFNVGSGAWKDLILPGMASVVVATAVMIYLGIAMSQMLHACVHQGLGPLQSLQESWRLTEGAKVNLFVLWLASIGLVLAGLLCLCVGAIPAMMVVTLSHPIIYFELLKQSGSRPGSNLA